MKCACDGRLWKIKSKGAILTLVLHFLVCSLFFTATSILAEIVLQDNVTAQEVYVPVGVALIVMGISCPVAGWLADACISRYKVLRTSIWLIWFGMLGLTVVALLAYMFPHCEHCQICFGIGALIVCVLGSVGALAYIVNAVQFGIDQMPEASGEELSAYIHWFVWVMFASNIISNKLLYLIRYCIPVASDGNVAIAFQLTVLTTMMSLALCCEFLFRGWLIIEPGCPNSLRMIHQVLKFAATHKYPIRRRAITYTEDEKPSRIDFAKDKYGGPFTTEQVEDVKTFFRIVTVVISNSLFFVPVTLQVLLFNFLLKLSSQYTCSQLSLQSSYSASAFAVVIIPLYTFMLYPLVRNRTLTMLQRIVLAAAMTVVLSGAILIIDSIKHARDPELTCMFDDDSFSVLKPELWWAIPFNFLIAVETVIGFTAMVEFTCAQSPYSMRGLLIGVQYSIVLFTAPLSCGIFLAWKDFLKIQVSPSCDFYCFLFQFLCAVVGLIVLCIVARWYKRRRREEEDDQRRIVEAIYDRILHQQTLFRSNPRGEVLEHVSS